MRVLFISLVSLAFFACTSQEKQNQEPVAGPNPESNWTNLVDLGQWRNYKQDTLSHLWQVEEGVLALQTDSGGGGYIITRDQFENFELEVEWKIQAGGNSGIMFNVVEIDSLNEPYMSGPEMQILDNDRHPDGKIPMHRASDNYDLQACSVETVKPAGEWNVARLVVNKARVEHWLNGTRVVEYELWSPDWEARLAKSKFTEWPAYGRSASGHICFQDHSDSRVWFRNARIRRL